MKVLHICFSDGQGGAAIGAYNLHKSMLKYGVDSKLLVAVKTTNDPEVLAINHIVKHDLPRRRRHSNRIESIIKKIQVSSNATIQSLNIWPTCVPNIVNAMNVDIVQLHWVGQNFVGIPDLVKFNKPVFWKMPDMWPFSGAEHYNQPGEPLRYRDGYLSNNKPDGQSGIDINRLIWNYKKILWTNIDIDIIGTTRWTGGSAKSSQLFSHCPVHIINNPINLDLFTPKDNESSRKKLGLPLDKTLVLFGAWAIESDKRKGFSFLRQALAYLYSDSDIGDFDILLFGTKIPDVLQDDINENVKNKIVNVHLLGKMEQDEKLVACYSASDVFVTAALLEGFGLTAAESLACGTPVVCFDTTGLKDVVDHKKTGYLASCYDAKDLARGIIWCLSQDKNNLAKACRLKVEAAFSFDKQTKKYLRAYQSRLSPKNKYIASIDEDRKKNEIQKKTNALLKVHSENPDFISSEGTQLVIEAYARSGNTHFVTLMRHQLRENNRDILSIAHHTHRIENLQLAILHNIPAVIIVRNPLDSISSFYLFNDKRVSIEKLAFRWREFYNFVRKNIDYFLIINFKTLISEPNSVFQSLKEYSGIDIPLIDDFDKAQNDVRNINLERSKGKRDNKNHILKMATPSERREKLKKEIIDDVEGIIKDLHLYDLYEAIIRESNVI